MTQARSQKGYNTHAIQKNLEEPGPSQEQSIQLQTQLQSQSKYQVEVDDDFIQGNEMVIDYRNEEVHKIEQEVVAVREMFKDLAKLVDEQQPTIDNITRTLENEVKVNVEAGNQAIEESDAKKAWCVIM